MKHHLFWHEPSNYLAIACLDSSLTLLEILEDEYKGLNPFYAYPAWYLTHYLGWVDLGELK